MSLSKHGSFCPACGAKNADDAKSCYACGAPLPENLSSRSEGSGSAPLLYQIMHNPMISSIITAVISLFLIIFAFCPFISVKTNLSEKASFTSSFSPVETIEYTAKAIVPYRTEKALLKSDELRDFEKAYAKISGISETKKLSSSQQANLAKFAKAAIVLDLVSPDGTLKANLVMTAVASLVYIILAIMALVSSLIALIKSLFGSNTEQYTRYASRKLSTIALGMPIFIILFSQAARFSKDSAFLGFGSGGTGIAWGLALTLVLTSAMAIFTAIKCFIRWKGFSEPHARHNARNRIITMLLLATSIITVFMPVISTSCAMPKTKRSVTKSADAVYLKELFEFSSEESDYYSEYLEYEDGFISLAEAVAKKKAEEGSGAELFHAAIYSNGNLTALYVITTIFAICFVILAATLLRRYLTAFLSGGGNASFDKHLKFTVLFASLYLIFSIVPLIVANSSLTYDLSRYVLFRIGSGPVLSLAITLAAYIFVRLTPIKNEAVEKFDNPDVSFAPYVIN